MNKSNSSPEHKCHIFIFIIYMMSNVGRLNMFPHPADKDQSSSECSVYYEEEGGDEENI